MLPPVDGAAPHPAGRADRFLTAPAMSALSSPIPSPAPARRRLAALLPALAGGALAVTALAARPAAAQLGTNLIVNGGAEAGAGSASGNDVLPVPGWATTGAFTVVQYGAAGGFPGAASPGPDARGAHFFSGGPARTSSSARQVLDLTSFGDAFMARVAGGSLRFTLAGYFGGFENQDDAATLTARFLGAGGTVVGSAAVGPVYALDRGGVTGLFARTLDGTLPTSTRLVEFTLDMAHGEGGYDDAYADGLSFTLASAATSTVPEPGTWALVGVGLAGVLGAAARRRTAPAA